MKCSQWSFAAFSLIVVMLLPLSVDKLNASESDLAARTFAAAETAKQQCMRSCLARYRDCRRLNQLPAAECRGIYHDCTRYSCTGLGPG